MILLDTHVVYWSLTDQSRLGRKTRHLISAASTRYVSAVTHVEFAIKVLKGKLHVPPGLPELLTSVGLAPLPFTDRHATAMVEFSELADHDPFDRMLLSQAKVDGLRFVTADRRLLALGLDWVVDARD